MVHAQPRVARMWRLALHRFRDHVHSPEAWPALKENRHDFDR
jgi:hypothetical protein